MDQPKRTKVFIVTGFLGAGKTTLVKQILRATKDLSKTVVLVNEFGKVGVDGRLIKQTAAADVVELASGCICCTLKTDMIQALRMLRYDYSPERILIEATGVADPVSIIEVLNERLLASEFVLEKTITVLDSDFWEAREGFGTVFINQMTWADLILLNKVDTLEPERVPVILDEIKEMSPESAVIPSLYCHIDSDLFWADQEIKSHGRVSGALFEFYDPAKDEYTSQASNETGSAQTKIIGFQTFSFTSERPMNEDGFNDFLETVPLELFRIKGPVKFESQTRMLNFVGGRIGWEPWSGTHSTNLAFIGWSVREMQVLEKVKNCLV